MKFASHIDQKAYESPNPTDGRGALQARPCPGRVRPLPRSEGRQGRPHRRKRRGARAPPEDEHFHSGPAQPRKFTIIVNGQKKVVTTKTVTFDEIVKLAFPTPPQGANILYTVSYEDGPRINPQGSMKEGQSVKVKNG